MYEIYYTCEHLNSSKEIIIYQLYINYFTKNMPFSSKTIQTLLAIMLFYSLITFFLFPVIGLYFLKTTTGILYGMILGFIVSIYLWCVYGCKMIKKLL